MIDPESNAFLIDVGSKTGTKVDGKEIEAHTPYPIQEGQIF